MSSQITYNVPCRARLQDNDREAQRKCFILPHENPEMFKLLVRFIDRSCLTHPSPIKTTVLSLSAHLLVDLFTFANAFDIPLLRNAALDALFLRVFVPTESLPLGLIPYIYEQTGEGSSLRDLMIDVVIATGSEDKVASISGSLPDDYYEDLIRAGQDGSEKASDVGAWLEKRRLKICKYYHLHEEGDVRLHYDEEMLPEQICKIFLDGSSTLWTCWRDSGAPVTFISTGRDYDQQSRRMDLSATIACNTLGSTPGWDPLNKLPGIVINPEVLVRMLARALTRQHNPLTQSGDTYIFQRPNIPSMPKPSIITKAWSKILRRRQKSAAASGEPESDASDDHTGLEDTDSHLSQLHGQRVERPDEFTLVQPEPADQYGPKVEVDEYDVETIYVPLLNADGMVVDYARKRTSSVKAVRKLRVK
ncbi:hypothetical protein E8E11_010176 [Didymella keratinophila]|nr:hypothetical protein E8E11_010176 [Didymella keratinophila]